MRSILGLAAAFAVLGSSIPATVIAAAPDRHSGYQAGVMCELTTQLGDVLLQIQDYNGFVEGGMLLWGPDAGPDDAPILASLPGVVALSGSVFEASFDLAPSPPTRIPIRNRLARRRSTAPSPNWGSRRTSDRARSATGTAATTSRSRPSCGAWTGR